MASLSSPAVTAVSATIATRQRKLVPRKVTYLTGISGFSGLKANNSVAASIGLPETTAQSFAKIVNALRAPSPNARTGGATCNAAAEIFKIAAIMNGLTLIGVAVGFVLLRIEAWVEESET